MYIDTQVARVAPTGGKLAVNLGDNNPATIDNNADSVSLSGKQLALFEAQGSGNIAVPSVIEWQSRNRFVLDSTQENAGVNNGTIQDDLFGGTFNVTTRQGISSHTVTNLSEWQTYNDWLIAELSAGNLTQSQYNAEYAKSWRTASRILQVNTVPIDETELPLIRGNNSIIHATGIGAVGRILPGGQVDSMGFFAALHGENGAEVDNQGIISGHNFGSGGRGGMQVNGANTRGFNSGVIGVGYLIGDSNQLGNSGANSVTGVTVDDQASFINQASGIINVRPSFSNLHRAISLMNKGVAENYGNINIGIYDTLQSSSGVFGVRFDSEGEFIGKSGSQIYLNRQPQMKIDDPSVDLASSRPTYGIYSSLNVLTKIRLEEGSNIAIGDKSQNGYGVFLSGSQVTADLAGTIDVNGGRGNAEVVNPLENRAIHLQNRTSTGVNKVTHSGVINLNGVNGRGIYSTTGGQIVNSGTINVNGGIGPLSGTRNFAVYAEGVNGTISSTVFHNDGTVNLNGNGAIGLHARDGGNITVSGGGLLFNGENQYGLFSYGKNANGTASSINITTAPASGLLADKQGAILARVEDGAQLTVATGTQLIGSGENSTLIQATGVGSVANLVGLTIDVRGKNAKAVRIEGGASGNISGATTLTLGDGATAVVIDNQKYDLNGNATGGTQNQSNFTNTVDITESAATDVTVFQIKNGAQLINSGNITLNHGTAIDISGEGSSLVEGASAGIISINDGVAGIRVSGGATLNTKDTIQVNGSAAGVLVEDDAGVVVIDRAAHITGLGSQNGNLVVSKTNGTTKIDGATLEMQGSGAALLAANNLDASSHGTIKVSSNNGGKGFAVMNQDGSETQGDISLNGLWQFEVSGNGSGVYLNTSGNFAIDNAQINLTNTADGIGIFAKQANTINIGSAARLNSQHANSVLIRGDANTVNVAGTLIAASSTDNAIMLGEHANSFNNLTGANITGLVDLGGGADHAQLQIGSTLTRLNMGSGNDTLHMQANSGAFELIDGGDDNDTLLFSADHFSLNHALASKLAGFDVADITNGAIVTLTGSDAMTQDVERVNVQDSARLMVTDQAAMVGKSVSLAEDAVLAISPALANSGDFTFNNTLLSVVNGAGRIEVALSNRADKFQFGADVGSAFNGVLDIVRGTFDLQDLNSSSLVDARLHVGSTDTASGLVKVGSLSSATQYIDQLSFGGGTLEFNVDLPNSSSLQPLITTNQLDASGRGQIAINSPATFDITDVAVDPLRGLMEQDDAKIGEKLISANTTLGSGGALTLVDHAGNAISAEQQVNIEQAGNLVAIGRYDYGLSSKRNDGLYVNYGLQQVDIQANQTLLLAPKTGASGLDVDLAAQIRGSGDLHIDAGSGQLLSLSNSLNDFSGQTRVVSGTLATLANNVFADSREVILEAQTQLDLNGFAQVATNLQGSGNVALGSGVLTVNSRDHSQFDGVMTGSGHLIKTGAAALTLTQDHLFSGLTEVQTGQLNLGNGGNGGFIRGDLAIATGATVKIDSQPDRVFSGVISGTGVLEKNNLNQLTLTGENSFSGVINHQLGTLQVGDGASSGSVMANIVNSSKLVFDRSNQSDYVGQLSGTGRLIKRGDGELRLMGSHLAQGSVTIDRGVLNLAQAGNFTTLGDFTIGSDSGLRVSNGAATLNIGGLYQHGDNSVLDIVLLGALNQQGPDIIAERAQLAGTLSYSGFAAAANVTASQIMDPTNRYELLRTTNGVSGTFSEQDGIDYLISDGFISADGNSYLLGFGLSWLAGGSIDGTGSFTLQGGSAFTVDVALADQQGSFASSWDGQSLTKNGAGDLMLSAQNSYSGSTEINGGALYLTGAGDISSSRQVNLTANTAVLDISKISADTASVQQLTGVAGSQLKLAGKSLTVNNRDNSTFAGDFDANAGQLIKIGSGALTLSGNTAYTGNTLINSGTLILDGSKGGGQLVSNVIGQSGTTLVLNNGASLTGWIDPLDVTIDRPSVWNMTGNSVIDSLTLSGRVNSEHRDSSFNTLVVNGNWQGNEGTLTINSELGGDNANTDLIKIAGNTSGTSWVNVNNIGGAGAQTVNGIKVIEVAGKSAGQFYQASRIRVGAYDYFLGRGKSDSNNWYLSSKLENDEMISPEVGGYTANLASANELFITQLHDRLGETHYIDPLSGEQKVTSMWLRSMVGDNRARGGDNALKSRSSRQLVQLGGDLAQWSTDDLSRGHLGVMAGYGQVQSDAYAVGSGFKAQGSVEGYSVGIYGNWFADTQQNLGLYTDSWLQYSWFDNSVKGDGLATQTYQSKGMSASLESGYTFLLGHDEANNDRYFIQPKGQVIWQGVKADEFTERSGTRVAGSGENNIQTRLGLRLFAHIGNHDSASAPQTSASKPDKVFQTFIETNWIYNTQQMGTQLDNVTVNRDGSGNIAELKMGVEGELSQGLQLSGNVAQQVGGHHYRDSVVTLGVRYSF
ncbi:autotransporter outer membrane beta-barrel domain-containing protein [Aeromonas cavernicola]|nr:autotransporter outer membrane beta-barrel domain-containing protein [Aeromonas cavernicola]